jgi:CRP/FNR family transcriptional regulator, cyclic AMP receptor protein
LPWQQSGRSTSKRFSPPWTAAELYRSIERIKPSSRRETRRIPSSTFKKGKIKVTVVSDGGKEAVVAIIEDGAFVGESCLTGQSQRLCRAAAMTDSVLMRLEKTAILRVLREQPDFSETFISHLLARNVRVEADLVDQLFNSSEKRLARLLLLMAKFGKEGTPEPIVAKISQETLADMIGTTRSRVSHFMNKFRQLGFIEYNGDMKIHSSC